MTTKPNEEGQRSRRWRSWLGYGSALLTLMAAAGVGSGLWAYQFGRRALEGVNPEPNSVRLPPPKSQPSPKPAPKKPDPSPQSYFLDEQQVIGDLQRQFAQELATYRRPPMEHYDPTRDSTVLLYRRHRERLAARIESVRSELQVRSVDVRRPLAELPTPPAVTAEPSGQELQP
ncbi:MAG: hypothetical protein HC919_04350 [Oscillatoriales cyanobacterium SM2_2_1]|nr:hypothetical protein [Oscillatoriales cyanobacterium SM2_2_1]